MAYGRTGLILIAMIDEHNAGLFYGRPALRALIAYAGGILIAEYIPLISIAAVVLAICLSIAGLIFHLRQKAIISTLLLLTALGAAGLAQYKVSTSGFPPTHVKYIAEAGNTVTVTGVIAEEPDVRSDRTYFVVAVDSLNWRRRQFESCGKIMLKVNQPIRNLAFRGRVRFNGSLFEPAGAHNPGGFDYAGWLANKEIFGMIVLNDGNLIELLQENKDGFRKFKGLTSIEELFVNKLVSPLRNTLLAGYDKYLKSGQADLLAGFVLGEKREMPDDIVKLFRDTGTLHLRAVSGSNVAILVAFFLVITFWVHRRLKILITLGAVDFFSFITRNEPSVVRASVMVAVGLFGFYRYKNPDVVGLLGFAGLILLIINPLWIYNVGFQLSFAACFGIIYLLPVFLSRLRLARTISMKALHWLWFAFLTTIAAQVMVLPLTAQYFNRLPVIGILANIPMVFLASVLTVAGICFLPFIILGESFTMIFAWPLSLVISVIIPLLEFFVDLPYSAIDVHSPGWVIIILFYSALYLLVELISFRRLSYKAFITVLVAVSGLIWIDYLKGPGVESITFIDCGGDRAVLYRDFAGNVYLWYDCYESSDCTQIEKSLRPYLLKADESDIDTVFTNDTSGIAVLRDGIGIGGIVQHCDIKLDKAIKIADFFPYHAAESILNKTVKFVGIKTDNKSEALAEGWYYKLSTSGGDCILAGSIKPEFAGQASRHAKIIELPWTAQPFGSVYRSLKESPPEMLIFSPAGDKSIGLRDKRKLTYFVERTWSVAFSGGFRVRFWDNKLHVDYMLEP